MSKKSKLQKQKSQQHKQVAQQKKDTAAILAEHHKNPPPDFELQVGDNNQEILNGDIQVRWCITEELIDALNESNVVDPHILLISAQKGSRQEMQRQLIPLTQLKTFVRCTKAGDVILHAWIINAVGGRKEINKKFMRKLHGDFATDMLDYAGEGYTAGREIAKYTSLPVVIPAGVFGKEPGPRMKRFVNMWHSNKAVDECNYRQRLIIACTIKWEAMIVYALVAMTLRLMLSFFVAGCGYRKNVNWNLVLQVFEFDAADIFSDEYGGNWLANDYLPKITHKHTDGYSTLNQYFFSFVPLIPSVVAFIYSIIYMGSDLDSVDSVVLTSLTVIALVKIGVVVDVLASLILWAAHTTMWDRLDKYIKYIDRLLCKRQNLGWRIVNTIGIVGLVMMFGYVAYVMWSMIQWAVLLVGSLALLFVFMYAMLTLFYKFFTIDEKHNNINDVKELLCNDCDGAVLKGESRIVPFPSRQRRIKLLYLETKNKVCKPMQQ